MLRGLSVLEESDEVVALAELFVTERVMLAPAVEGDALHVAPRQSRHRSLAHVERKASGESEQRTHLGDHLMRLGLSAPQIVTPDMLQETDDE